MVGNIIKTRKIIQGAPVLRLDGLKYYWQASVLAKNARNDGLIVIVRNENQEDWYMDATISWTTDYDPQKQCQTLRPNTVGIFVCERVPVATID